MNGEDPFEASLKRQPRRSIPPAWRGEILASARQAATFHPSRLMALWSQLSPVNLKLSAFLWPHPKAWAGLAAAWLLILALSFAARDSSTQGLARHVVPASPQMRELLLQQERILTEVADLGEKSSAASVARPLLPRPQSQGRGAFLNT